MFDADRAWRLLKAEIAAKTSHGKRDLLARMGELEVECDLPDGHDPGEGAPQRGQPATDRRSDATADGNGRGPKPPLTPEEGSHGEQHRRAEEAQRQPARVG